MKAFGNFLRIKMGGLWMALSHVVFAVLMAISPFGISSARQHIKLPAFAFTPFDYQLR